MKDVQKAGPVTETGENEAAYHTLRCWIGNERRGKNHSGHVSEWILM